VWYLNISEVLKDKIIDFNYSRHNCWNVLSRRGEKKSNRYFKGEEKGNLKLFVFMFIFLFVF